MIPTPDRRARCSNLSISDATVASILDKLRVLEQSTLLVLERRGLELKLPALQLLGSRVDDIDNIVVSINSDGIAVTDKTDGTALLGLRGDVANEETVAAAGEAAVGDERDVVAETVAHDGGAGLE
jgi:hypothetical protein